MKNAKVRQQRTRIWDALDNPRVYVGWLDYLAKKPLHPEFDAWTAPDQQLYELGRRMAAIYKSLGCSSRPVREPGEYALRVGARRKTPVFFRACIEESQV